MILTPKGSASKIPMMVTYKPSDAMHKNGINKQMRQ